MEQKNLLLDCGPGHSDSRSLSASDAVAATTPALFSRVLDYPALRQEAIASPFDLMGYLQILLKRRRLIAAAIAIPLLLTLIFTLMLTPVYRAMATIQIDRNTVRVMDVSGLQENETSTEADFFLTQYELLKSRSLAERVVVSLNLADAPRFVGPPPAGLLQRIRGLFGSKPKTEAPADVLTRKAVAVSKLAANLLIAPVQGSRIVRIFYSDPDPKLAQEIANGVAQGFIAENIDRRYASSNYARHFLEDRITIAEAKLEESERAAVAYATREHIVGGDDKQPLVGEDLTAINTALTHAKIEKFKLEQLWTEAKGSNIYGLPQVLENKALEANRERRTQLAADYQQKLTMFKPSFPDMLQIKAQINELDRQAAQAIGIIKESIHSQYNDALEQEKNLEQRLEDKKSEALSLRERSIKYTILQREVNTNRTLYDGLLQRYKEIGVAGGLVPNNISIVDRSETPASPYSPDLLVNLSIALFAGLLAGIGGALLLEHMDGSIKSPEDVETRLDLPLLGIIPKLADQAALAAALNDQRSNASEAYRSLHTTLQFSTPAGFPSSLAVTSSRSFEGKSTTALALAQTCARFGAKVLLVDADMRRPSLHQSLGLLNTFGLSNFLAGTAKVDIIIQKTSTENLHFIASGLLPPNPPALLTGPKLASLLKYAAEFFDTVILDSPPVLGLSDAPLICHSVAGTCVVVEANGVRIEAAKVAIKRLLMARTQILGVLLSKFEAKSAGYGYGYSYYGEDAQPKRLTRAPKQAAEAVQG